MKHVPKTKNKNNTYFAGHASRLAVRLQQTPIAAKTKNNNAEAALRYTPAYPAHRSTNADDSRSSHPSNHASVT